jgi:hypothetical protein
MTSILRTATAAAWSIMPTWPGMTMVSSAWVPGRGSENITWPRSPAVAHLAEKTALLVELPNSWVLNSSGCRPLIMAWGGLSGLADFASTRLTVTCGEDC